MFENAKNYKEAIKAIEKEYLNKIFEDLKLGILDISPAEGYMEAYLHVQVCADYSDANCYELYNYYNIKIKEFITFCMNELVKENEDNLINKFFEYTDRIYLFIYYMQRIFCYLDRFFTKVKVKNPLSNVGADLYKSNFLKEFQPKVLSEIFKLIREERNAKKDFLKIKIKKLMEIVQDMEIKNPIIKKKNNIIKWEDKNNDIISLESIEILFYNEYYKYIEEYLKTKSNEVLNENSISEYISSQMKYMEKEYEKLNYYFNNIQSESLIYLYYEYIVKPLEKIDPNNTIFISWMENENLEIISNLYKLSKYDRDNKSNFLQNKVKSYIKFKCENLRKNEEISKNVKTFIPELNKLIKNQIALIRKLFENDNKFINSIIIPSDYYSKQLSVYVDYCMRIGFKGKSKGEIENTLNDIIITFNCLNSKTVFIADSNNKMTDRLIKNETLSLINEQYFITKLKEEIGLSSVNIMQGLISDLETSKKDSELFRISDHQGAPYDIKLDVKVISDRWKINQKYMEKIELPKFLSSCLDSFEKFYINRHEHQKLFWFLGLSRIEIQYLYLNNKNISVSTLPQLLTLFLLEEKGELSLKEISDLLGCKLDIIIDNIQGLVYNPSFNPNSQNDKGIIIGTFNGETKEFIETDKIKINVNFICERIKFSTIPLSKKKSDSELKKEEKEEKIIIKKYEDNILQSTIARIMKSRIGVETNHSWLVGETSKQVNLFNAKPQQIKENIEKLIEKNIIKRTDKDGSCYEYIA